MFIYGGLKECTGGTKHRINGTQAVKYSVVHRFAVRNKYKGKGVAKYIFDYVKNKYDYIRVDTHPDNKSMIKCLYNNGFTYRGDIFLNRTGFNLRNAYDYLSN